MLYNNFVKCILSQLGARGFGEKRAEKLIRRFDGLHEGYKAEGMTPLDALVKAQDRLFDELKRERVDKFIAAQVAAEKHIKGVKLLDDTLASKKKASRLAWDGGNTVGANLARALVAFIEQDPRKNVVAFTTAFRQRRSDMLSQLGEGLAHYGKGIFARNRGTADQLDIIKAAWNDFGGKKEAVAMYRAFKDAIDGSLQTMRKMGGRIDELEDFRLPDPMTNVYELQRRKSDGTLLDFLKEHLDLGAMRRAEGGPLPQGPELDKILMEAVDVKLSDGAARAAGAGMRGHGTVGKSEHRFFKWKSPESYQAAFNELGTGKQGGTVQDMMFQFMISRAHDIAALETFGRNPKQMMDNLIVQGRAMAAKLGLKDQNQFDYVVERRLRPMLDAAMGKVVPDPDSLWAIGAGTLANIVRGSVLANAPLIAVPSDQVGSAFIRRINNLGGKTGVDDIVRYFAMSGTKEEAVKFDAMLGFVRDSLVESLHEQDRLSRFATVGPAWSRKSTSVVMRANGMTWATEQARSVMHKGLLAELAQRFGTAWEDLPFRSVLERYEIGKADWDVFRALAKTQSPRPNVIFADLPALKTAVKNGDKLYSKFMGFVMSEAQYAVPEAGLEAHIILSGGQAPDTMIGALAHSFSMFKNMAVYIPMIFARQIMAKEGTKLTKTAYAGAVLAALTSVGALKLQMQEVISNNRTPWDMKKEEFWLRSLAAGGGLGFMGDVVFGSADTIKGRGLNDIIAGATAVPGGQAIELVGSGVENAYKAVKGEVEWSDAGREFGHKATELVEKNFPATFYTRPVMHRLVFDKIDAMIDPEGNAKRNRQKEKAQAKRKGNEPLQR